MIIKPRKDGNGVFRMEEIGMRRVVKNRNAVERTIEERQILDKDTINIRTVITVQTVVDQRTSGVESFTNLVGVVLDTSSEDGDFEVGGDIVDELLGTRAKGYPDRDGGLVGTHVDVEVKIVLVLSVRALCSSMNEGFI